MLGASLSCVKTVKEASWTALSFILLLSFKLDMDGVTSKDTLQLKTCFGGRQPSVEDDFWWKMTFGGGLHLVKDDLSRKTTFGGK